MADTSLKRVGTNSYTAMLTEKREFKDWKKPTVLARFTEENGASTMFTLVDDAYNQFKDLENRESTLQRSLVHASGIMGLQTNTAFRVLTRFA